MAEDAERGEFDYQAWLQRLDRLNSAHQDTFSYSLVAVSETCQPAPSQRVVGGRPQNAVHQNGSQGALTESATSRTNVPSVPSLPQKRQREHDTPGAQSTAQLNPRLATNSTSDRETARKPDYVANPMIVPIPRHQLGLVIGSKGVTIKCMIENARSLGCTYVLNTDSSHQQPHVSISGPTEGVEQMRIRLDTLMGTVRGSAPQQPAAQPLHVQPPPAPVATSTARQDAGLVRKMLEEVQKSSYDLRRGAVVRDPWRGEGWRGVLDFVLQVKDDDIRRQESEWFEAKRRIGATHGHRREAIRWCERVCRQQWADDRLRWIAAVKEAVNPDSARAEELDRDDLARAARELCSRPPFGGDADSESRGQAAGPSKSLGAGRGAGSRQSAESTERRPSATVVFSGSGASRAAGGKAAHKGRPVSAVGAASRDLGVSATVGTADEPPPAARRPSILEEGEVGSAREAGATSVSSGGGRGTHGAASSEHPAAHQPPRASPAAPQPEQQAPAQTQGRHPRGAVSEKRPGGPKQAGGLGGGGPGAGSSVAKAGAGVPKAGAGVQRAKGEESEDLVVDLQEVSLICPLSQSRIQTPVKGQDCSHVACFDLSTWNIFAETATAKKKPNKCPHCSKEVSAPKMDSKFLALLDKVDASQASVMVDKNWQVLSDTQVEELKASAAAGSGAEPDRDVIVLDDDD